SALTRTTPGRAMAPEPGRLDILVFGAHLSGMALNGDLKAMGGRFVRTATTAAAYRMKRLPGAIARPGVVRVSADGAALDGEIWSLPFEGVGKLLATIPAPLGLGQVELADGTRVTGFLAEAAALDGAEDITAHGGFRAFMAATVPA
ncbi:allophanate hydrolase-related protein, partial [Xanthobacter autotrophicus]|uniref:allophanate hydrolase-related protein n=1 Tax=Xanthobacter autotrophicus TaxID=280 RepID=UPI0024AAFCCE|nr:allophanate hydrolase [Xanthobacter autotrophicus]